MAASCHAEVSLFALLLTRPCICAHTPRPPALRQPQKYRASPLVCSCQVYEPPKPLVAPCGPSACPGGIVMTGCYPNHNSAGTAGPASMGTCHLLGEKSRIPNSLCESKQAICIESEGHYVWIVLPCNGLCCRPMGLLPPRYIRLCCNMMLLVPARYHGPLDP